MKKFLLIALLLTFAFTFASCETDSGSNADLTISFFNGGYGEDWINNLVARFEEKEGVTVKIVKSADADCGAINYIKSSYNLSDIYIGEGIPWKSLVQEGLLADLTDVYEAEVETRNGTQKIKDFMDQNIVGNFYSQRKLKVAEYHPYAMPWSAKVNAMAYNEDILLEVRHVSSIEVTQGLIGQDGKWDSYPRTVQDLKAFCEDVNAFNANSAEKQALNDTHTYVPFGWCGSINADSLGFMIITWWAEAQGLTKSNYTGEGSFYDFFNYGNTTDSNIGQTIDLGVFKQSGLKLAYNTLAEVLFDDNGNYQNTLSDPYNTNLQQLQRLFVANTAKEKPVLSIAASYLESEVIKNLCYDSDLDGKQDVNFKFMNVPSLNADAEELLYLNFTDSIIVPAKAAHVELAKKFLIFMSSESEVANFAKDTNGGIRPFNCDVREEVTGFKYSAFTESLFDVYYNSTKFYEYPCNTTSLAEVSHIFRYNDPTYHGNVGWLTMINFFKTARRDNLDAGQIICDAVLEAQIRDNLDAWIRKFQLTDNTQK